MVAKFCACAKARECILGTLVTAAPQPHCNEHMRAQSLPDPKRFNTLRERMGHWEINLEWDDPKVPLGAAVGHRHALPPPTPQFHLFARSRAWLRRIHLLPRRRGGKESART